MKVYYCSNGLDTIDGVNLADLGKENGKDTALTAGSGLAKLVSGSDAASVTKADLKGISKLEINSTSGVENFNELYNFTSLSDLTLKDLTLDNLDGIEYLAKLNRLFIINCTIGNYSKLGEIRNQIIHLYLQNATNDEIRKLCDSTIGIGGVDFPNLAYFGIYGQKNFIDDYSYKDRSGFSSNQANVVHSSFDNLTYLLNLNSSTITKITNLFLNNNSISDISCLSSFTGVTNLRIEGNYIKKLDGIYDSANAKGMISLQHLHAYNNLIGQRVAVDSPGETSGTLNLLTDGLSGLATSSYDEESDTYSFVNRFTSLKYLDLGNNYIKNLDYISCNNSNTNFTTLYIDKNSSINLENGIQSIMSKIESNGFSLTCDQYVTDYIIDNSKKIDSIDLHGKIMTVTEFTNYLSGRANYLKKLILKDLVLKDSSGNIVTDSTTVTFDEVMEDVLSSFTKMAAIDLNGLEYLTEVDFVEGMTGLKQIDLRGTKVANLSKIVQFNTNLEGILLDYSGIKVVNDVGADGKRPISDVERLFNRLDFAENAGNNISGSYSIYTYGKGVLLCDIGLLGQLANSENITGFHADYNSVGWKAKDAGRVSVTLDLRKTKITSGFFLRSNLDVDWTLLLPSTITKVRIPGVSSGSVTVGAECLSSLTNLESVAFSFGQTWDTALSMMKVLPNLKSFSFYAPVWIDNYNFEDVFGSACAAISTLESLSLTCYSGGSQKGFTNSAAAGLSGFSNLKKLTITYAYNLTNYTFLNSLTQLTDLTLNYTGISSLGFLEVTAQLEKLDLSGCTTLGIDGYDLEGEPIFNLDLIQEAFGRALREVDLKSCGIAKDDIKNHAVSSLAWTSFKY